MKKTVIRLILAVSLAFSSVAAVNVFAEDVKQDNRKVEKIKESKNSKALEEKVHKNNGKEKKESNDNLQSSKILQYRFENIKKLKQHIANLALYMVQQILLIKTMMEF